MLDLGYWNWELGISQQADPPTGATWNLMLDVIPVPPVREESIMNPLRGLKYWD